jgi:DNA-binding NtrC family response regulator
MELAQSLILLYSNGADSVGLNSCDQKVYTKAGSGRGRVAGAGVMYIVLQNTIGSGASWPLGPVPLIIGRGVGCDIRVSDEALSRRHAKIWLENGAVRFEDLGSSNATLVNGCPADTGALRPGDTLGAGSAIFRVAETIDPRIPRRTGPGATPITLAVGLTSFLQDPGETRFEAPSHRTVHELHDLFHLARSLGPVESVRDLTALLERTLREKFEPSALWIAWRYADDQPLLFQTLDESDTGGELPQGLLERALNAREGIVKPVRNDAGGLPRTLMAVPLVHVERALGGFVLASPPGRIYTEGDLHYALGIAALAAPHVRAVRQAEQLRRDNEALQARADSGARLLGESPAIAMARDLLARAARSALPVLLQGETGTGKEIAARMLHEASARRGGPYVVVNCAAIPGDLFESEFFGHEKGAFTGATRQRIGRFEEADGGTLFLDEIGDLSLDNQARILRAIENSTFHRVGGGKPIHVNVRIVSATNKPLAEPAFRLDLLHRLNGVTIPMPPLRKRPEDLAALAEHFIRLSGSHGPIQVTGIRPDALALLQRHDWPGNVRELKARIDRAVLFARGSELTAEELQLTAGGDADTAGVIPAYTHGVSHVSQADTSRILTLAEIEREHIQYVLRACNGNIAKAARTLGTNRVLLYKRIAEYGGK